MDLSSGSETPTPYTTVGGPALEQELSLPSAHCQTESGCTLLLQLLEFKTHLVEAVEELHIRKDAETLSEGQISKLVLEKQKLEWEKESLQHQIETVSNQHTESLSNVKKQFQAKIRNVEEEKGKFQVSAELKDKEINNLKEELRSLQLLKYNLEKKSNELEQKLALQSRSKDSHLNQLGEVEKQFSALSRKCAMVKQAHEKLEQTVDEAMRINKKLTSTNEKQEVTIVSLKKALEEVSNKLIKVEMTSIRHDKTHSHTSKEQYIQKLHQKLNMETAMNKKLREENVAVRAEKQEVMRSLQHTQQLLLSQTQTVNGIELELHTQREQYQVLKQEHEVMRDKSKAMEDKVAQLMECHAASKTSWAKEMRNSSQVFHLTELNSSSELPGSGSLQQLAFSQIKNTDCLEDAGPVTKLVTGGQEAINLQQQFQFKQPLNTSNLLTCPLITNSLFSPCSHCGTTGNDSSILSSESDPDVASDLMYATSPVTDVNFLISKVSCVSGTTSNSDHKSINTSVGLLSKEKNEEGGAEERVKTAKHTSKTPETHILAQTTTDWTSKKSNIQQVIDCVGSEPPQAVYEPSDNSSFSQKVIEKDTDSSHVNKEREICREGQLLHTLSSDGSVDHGLNTIQNLCHDEVQTQDAEPLSQMPNQISEVSDKSAEGKQMNRSAADFPTEHSEPQSQSRTCGSQTNAVPLAAPTDTIVSIQELETTTAQTVPSLLSDITSNMKQTDEMCVSGGCVLLRTLVEPQPLSQSWEISEQVTNNDDDGDSSKYKGEGQSNVGTQENYDRETFEKFLEKSNFKDVCVGITMDTVDLEVESGTCQNHKKDDKIEDTKDEKTTKSETNLKLSVPNRPKVSFDLVSALHQFVQGSEQNISGSGGHFRPPPGTIPMSPKSKHSKVPLMITRGLKLLNASSVSGSAATSMKHQQEEWKALGETCRDTTDMESRASLSISSLPVPTSSSTVSRPSWQAIQGCSRALTSAPCPVPESDWEPSCSQEREDQQSSFRSFSTQRDYVCSKDKELKTKPPVLY